MAMNIINKYVWLVETIYRAHKISFEDINRKWLDDEDFSEGVELPLRRRGRNQGVVTSSHPTATPRAATATSIVATDTKRAGFPYGSRHAFFLYGGRNTFAQYSM